MAILVGLIALSLAPAGCARKTRATVSDAGGASATPASWQATTVAGKFSAKFPVPPKQESKTEATDAGVVSITDYTAWDGRAMYTLRHTERPVYKRLPPESVGRVLDVAIEERISIYERTQGGKLLDRSTVSLAGEDGRACTMSVQSPMRGTNFVRIFIVAGQYYDLMVFVGDGAARDEHEAFFAAFAPDAK